jgi:diacylglycerol O-acyltransferase / wax synthase
MNHQRRFHTLVTHVRGPVEPVGVGGHEVAAAIPVAVAEGGNMTVYFEVLSYAGVSPSRQSSMLITAQTQTM